MYATCNACKNEFEPDGRPAPCITLHSTGENFQMCQECWISFVDALDIELADLLMRGLTS